MDLILPCNDTSHLPLRFKDEKKKAILHYSHRHELSFFKYRKVREEGYDCLWCEKHLLPSEVCYGCRYCKFYLHQMCNFRLDFDCAKLSPSLKLDCHHHLLTFFKDFKKGEEGQDSYCKACGKHYVVGSVCSCVQCHFTLHLECVVPSSARHKYHRHPLIMMELIKEDDSEKYYCDVCENERNPKDLEYYCQSCTFIAHIQCVLDQDKVASRKVSSSSPPPMENKALFVDEMEQNEGTNVIRTLDSFIEDDSGKYYCEECNGQIIAHIEHVLAEVEDNIEIRKNNHEQCLRKK
ncbi:hypothetical protein Gohar_022375, partial [Gossypium harknessii]|nr:hypothetical protein [Gossypium harknessii]